MASVSFYDPKYSAERHGKNFCKSAVCILSRIRKAYYVVNCFYRKRRRPSRVKIIISSLAGHINSIVSSSPGEKMFWVYAWWIVTFMEHVHSFRDRAICEFPRNTMRQKMLPSDSRVTVPVTSSPGHPKPTGFAFFNLLPKPLANRYTPIESGAWLASCAWTCCGPVFQMFTAINTIFLKTCITTFSSLKSASNNLDIKFFSTNATHFNFHSQVLQKEPCNV